MPTSFETFINNELPLRVSTLDAPVSGDIPVFTGVGKLTEAKSTSELGLATTSYVDTAVTKVWKDQGDYNVSGGTAWPTSANTIGAVPIKAGFLWVVAGAAVDGTTLIGGKIVSNGDTIRALVDAATNSGADWGVNEANLGYTPENKANKAIDLTLPDDTKYPTTLAVSDALSGKQNTLPDVITADTYGSSTQYPVITFNAKGIATGVTLQTPTFTDATFSVQKNGSPAITASWSLTAFTESHVHTYPDKAIDFGDLPSVATTDSNTLSGTRCRIVGGSGNNVSGTQNLVANSSSVTASGSYSTALNCKGANLSGTGITVIGGSGSNVGTLRDNTILLGTSTQANLFIFATSAAQRLNALYGTTLAVPVSGTIYATINGSQTLTNLNCLQAVTQSGDTSSHEVEFIVSVGTNNGFGGILPNTGVLIARRRIHVFQQSTSGTFFVGSMQTVGTDVSLGTITGTFTPTLTVDTVNNRLECSVVRTGGVAGQEGVALSVRTVTHHTR